MAVKTFPYAVIFNGTFYPANTEIPVVEEKEPAKPTSKKAVSKNDKGTDRKA